MYLRPIFLGIFSFLILTVSRGEMISPLKIPLLMSANFGELRPNHFHSGIDLKTQGRIGLPVYAMDDGYGSLFLRGDLAELCISITRRV